MVSRMEPRAGDCVPSIWGHGGGTGLGLTVATGSLLRVATRLSFLTWVLVFMASQMAFSVEMGMSCGKGMWVSPRGCRCHQGDGDIPEGMWVSPRGCKWQQGGADVSKGDGASLRGCWVSHKGCKWH